MLRRQHQMRDRFVTYDRHYFGEFRSQSIYAQIPSHRLTTYGRRRAFSVGGPMFWNSLVLFLDDY